MKTLYSLLIVAIALLSACSTPKSTVSNKNYDDDIYYSSADAAKESSAAKAQQQREQINTEAKTKDSEHSAVANTQNDKPTQTNTDDDYYSPSKNATSNSENTGISTSNTISNRSQNASFNYDDYYDYEYAVRLRRFHNTIPAYGYYDNFYTNSYWYTGNPYNYGTSVYMGYNFWGPSYMSYSYQPQMSWYSSWGWGYDPWYNPYSYHPYYYNPYGYYGYNPYMNGYWNGHHNGHWNNHHFNNDYFNSYDKNSYYGPRNSNSLNANGKRSSEPTMAHRYMTAVETETSKPFNETKGRTNNPYLNPVKEAIQIKNMDINDRPVINSPTKNQIGNTTQPIDVKHPIDFENNSGKNEQVRPPLHNINNEPIKQVPHQVPNIEVKEPINHNPPNNPVHNNIPQNPINVSPNNNVKEPVIQEPIKTPDHNNVPQNPINVSPNNNVEQPILPQQPIKEQPTINDRLETPRSQPRYEEPRSQPRYEERRSEQPRNNNNSYPSTPRGGSSGSTPRPR